MTTEERQRYVPQGFGPFFFDQLERTAAATGDPVDAARLESARQAYRDRDPVCWAWPAPETVTFKDEDSATTFLYWWNRECATCGSAGDLVVDHDHRTGLIRGRLCGACNSLEGHASNDYGLFRKYRERNPATILGIKAQYWSPWTGYAEPKRIPMPEESAAEQAALRDAVDRMTLPSPELDQQGE